MHIFIPKIDSFKQDFIIRNSEPSMDKTSNSINNKNNQFVEGTQIGTTTGKGNWAGYAFDSTILLFQCYPMRY